MNFFWKNLEKSKQKMSLFIIWKICNIWKIFTKNLRNILDYRKPML